LSNSFTEGRALLDRYTAHVELALRALPPGSDAARDLEDRVRRLFEWADVMALAAREFASAELARLQLVAGYRDADDFPRLGLQA
jgi:hypothetical protein